MGEVYRARDTKLRRDVALKILAPVLAADSDRRARFTREAQVLAVLNHPHIAAIHGIEEQGSATALVLELVEGPTLDERIASGPVPLADTLSFAAQLVDALEAAHDKGIIHRDLKPANIKLTSDDRVKVLDFGLAKALGEDSAEALNSPTLTAAASRLCGIIGTAAYMSPEQRRQGRRQTRGHLGVQVRGLRDAHRPPGIRDPGRQHHRLSRRRGYEGAGLDPAPGRNTCAAGSVAEALSEEGRPRAAARYRRCTPRAHL
jgi:serine/threonine-protein kinase